MFCWKCGEDNNDRYVFCITCAANLRSPLPGETSRVPDTVADSSDKAANGVPAFASNISYREHTGKLSKVLLIAGAGLAFLVFMTIAAVLVWRQVSTGDKDPNGTIETGSNTAKTPAVGENNSNLSNLARRPSKADAEFDRINVELNSADFRKKKSVVEAEIKGAESKYPDDYRFAYQAAKLEAIASKGHHEAFEMLFLTAKKAIETGKSAELLIDLQKDGSSSLKRLIDHKEWAVLNNALRKNDVKALEENSHD
jgi:hypothetical protein